VKRLIILTVIVLAAFTVQAQDVELREDHPREYVVQEGDTLWDIAGRFLARPWQWPTVWDANPQIDNPHLIYPGDVISLVFVGGEPRLRVADRVRRLSPEVRAERVDQAISTLPLDAIDTFLRNPRIVSEEAFEQLPYVLANHEQRVFVGPGERTYVRGLDGSVRVGDEVVLAHVSHQFVDRSGNPDSDTPIRTNRMRRGPGEVPSDVRPASSVWKATIGRLDRFDYPVIGYELWETGRAEVLKTGDPAVLEIKSGRRETAKGDYVLPIDDHVYDPTFYPRAMEAVPSHARVLTTTDSGYGAGHYQIVAINLGEADGVAAGHVFSVFRPGETIRDQQGYPPHSRVALENLDKRYVELPREYAGQVMVFRPFERVSYAIVLEGSGNAIRVDDRLDHPDRRL